MEPIGMGILGCGFIAQAHNRGYLQFPTRARIVALSGRSEASTVSTREFIRTDAQVRMREIELAIGQGGPADRLAALEGDRSALWETVQRDVRVSTSCEGLASDPDVMLVSNTTPPFVHYLSTLDLLRAGKHVLVEKPFVGSLRHADALITEAVGRHLCLSVVSQGRFADDQRRMHALVRQGKLGRVFLLKVDTHWYRQPDYYALWWRGNWANECGGAF